MCAEMVSYARKAWRSGDRVTATGVLEHGADLIARAVEGQPAVAAAAQAAKSRTHLAWADMQSVRLRVPETEATPRTRANATFALFRFFSSADLFPLRTSSLFEPLPSSYRAQDFGELAHAHATAAEACDAAERSGPGYASDRVTAHVAAAVAAARCHRANATRVAPDPETGRATPWDVLALEDHLEDAAGAALAAEDEDASFSSPPKEDGGKARGGEKEETEETGPGLEPSAMDERDATSSARPRDKPRGDARAGAFSLRIATLGGRCASASALNDADAAFDAACDIFSQLEHVEWARHEGGGGWDAFARGVADAPHGAAVASALKFAGHWAALRGAGAVASDAAARDAEDGDANAAAKRHCRVAMRAYDRAEAVAKAVASSSAPEAAAAALAADELIADVALSKAQLMLRMAVDAFERGDSDSPEEKAPLADAEAAAAAAVTAAEATGDPGHPRVGIAVACSADVYVAKAVLAAKGKGGVGDGAGVLFADGLYRNALQRFGTTKPPTAVASDPDAAAGGAAPAHLRLVAALAHAKYAAVLRASGANRAGEADAWSSAALKEWDDDFSQTLSEDMVPPDGDESERGSAAIRAAAGNIGSVGKTRAILDGQLMMPVVG